MINTPNYNLNKFQSNDKFNKDYINENFDKIDDAINDLQDTFNNNASGGALTTKEVVDARGGKESLKDKIDEIDTIQQSHSSSLEDIAPYIIYEYKNTLTDNEIPNSYLDVYVLYDELVSKYPKNASMKILGKTDDNEEIRQYTFTSSIITNNIGERKDRNKMLITACIHGDEKGGAYYSYKFLKDILESNSNGILYEIKSNYLIRIIPVCNPYGYNNNQRWNKNKIDLARNFDANWVKQGIPGDYNYSGESVASEKETQIIQKFIDDNSYFDVENAITSADILIDIHNTAQGGEDYRPDLKDQFTWFVSSDDNNYRNQFMRGLYQKSLQKCSLMWGNRHLALKRDVLYGMYTGLKLANIETYSLNKGIKSCQLEVSWNISDIDTKIFGSNTLKIGIESLGNLILEFNENIKYFNESPILIANPLDSFSANNGSITKIPLKNVIYRTNNINLTDTGGVIIPRGFSKAIITLTTSLDKSIVTGSIEHRVYISDDKTDNGTNNICNRNSYQIISSPSLDKINTSYFIIDNLKTSQVINFVIVQVTGNTITLKNSTTCKVLFEK